MILRQNKKRLNLDLRLKENEMRIDRIIHKSFNNHGGAMCWRGMTFEEVHSCWWSIDWRFVTCPDCKNLRKIGQKVKSQGFQDGDIHKV